MRNVDEYTITQAVIARHAQAPDARLRDVMTSLVQHLHAFAREVRLTEDEWFQGLQFLADTGRLCDDKRQEFILLSDTLGLSMLVAAMNQRQQAGTPETTEATGPRPQHGESPPLPCGPPGEPCFVRGQVRGPAGEPVAGAELQVWPAGGAEGLRVQADAAGRFDFRAVVAREVAVPTDGPGGRLLAALGRPAARPAHLPIAIVAPGYRRLVTQVFRHGDPHLDSDAVFGVRRSLIADWVPHAPGPAPDGSTSAVPFYTLDFDFVLERAALPT